MRRLNRPQRTNTRIRAIGDQSKAARHWIGRHFDDYTAPADAVPLAVNYD